jgi:hypothetical protein
MPLLRDLMRAGTFMLGLSWEALCCGIGMGALRSAAAEMLVERNRLDMNVLGTLEDRKVGLLTEEVVELTDEVLKRRSGLPASPLRMLVRSQLSLRIVGASR